MLKLVPIILLSIISLGANALGVGNIELNSGLNQPFDARIELLAPTPTEMTSLTVRLADAQAFDRAGIDRPFYLSTLQFEIEENASGADYIRVTTREPVREPFLHFLLEASWSNGRIYREYTVLLDPPLFDPNAGRTSAPQAPAVTPRIPTAPAVAGSGASSSPVQSVSTFSGAQFGPVSSVDTLWSIANQTRPDGAISAQQMMLALLRANPEAFIGNNINGLRQGQILRIPSRDEITQNSHEQAFAEVQSQNAMWDQMRGTLAESVPDRPVSTASQPVSGSPTPIVQNESELRLVAPGDQASTDSGQTTGVISGGSSTGSDNFVLLEEQLNTLTSENVDLRDQLADSEALIDDLRRLIELKDDELAVLQQSVAGAEVELDQDTETGIVEQDSAQVVGDAVELMDEQEETRSAPVATEESEEIMQPAPAPVAPAVPAPVPVQQGLVDQIIGVITDNLMIIGGVLALLIAGFVVARKRKGATEADQAIATTDFPDFKSTADETAVPDSDGPEINIDIDPDTSEADVAGVANIAADSAQPVQQPAEAAASTFETEEDPLAEVNVFLAYEHFDQAEEFVRDAIKKDPENLDFHNKLLEVFYSSGDKSKYETEARILHDLVGGQGPHWDMATIMWQEISPNRALFAEAAGGDDDAREDITSGRGIVDLTADDSTADDDAGLDFDLGMDMGSAATNTASGSDDGVLDITAGTEDVLDVTAAESADSHEDLLDVTAAVGLGSMDSSNSNDDNLLDFDPNSTDDDMLDISASGDGGEDLLDVTAHSDFDADDEDVLDITASSTGSDSSSLSDNSDASAANENDDNALDFDIGGIQMDADTDSSDRLSADNINPDTGNAETLEFTLDTGSDEDGGFELDLDSGDDNASGDDGLLGLDLDDGDDTPGLDMDFANNEVSDETLEFKLDADSDDTDGGIELDFGTDDNESAASALDMESTVKLGRNTLSLVDDEDQEDEGDHTVFVPRTGSAAEQSMDDEIATKLDLAKAYVELGDGDSAKSILEEVVSDGNASQRQQAQELMSQIG